MVRLLVIADDFTGALDTGVQFKTKDSLVLVYTQEDECLREVLKNNVQVLIVDAETRHMKPQDAFCIIHSIVKVAIEVGVSYIYKKTDSGMRGNIGSELTALLLASGKNQIHYFPAFPQMGRTTVNGIHYIDGIPVSESVFGKDPFEPVKNSVVKDIIAEQSDVKVYQMGTDIPDNSMNGILVYDGKTEDEMYQRARALKEKGQLCLLAGCAGFAAILFELLELSPREDMIHEFNKNLLIICGSLNSVTIKQLEYAANAGMNRVYLRPEQKLKENWLDSEDGKKCITAWKEEFENYGDMIIECGVHDLENTSEYMKKNKIELSKARSSIADTMGGVLERLLRCGVQTTILVTGGDTLLAFMQHINQNTLIPICEVVSGVVLSQIEYKGRVFNLLSKSGGFGQEDLLVKLATIVKQKNV